MIEYPLAKKINSIVDRLLYKLDQKFPKDSVSDLKMFLHFIGSELIVNATLLSFKQDEQTVYPTIEVLFEKNYTIIQELQYKKYWACDRKLPVSLYLDLISSLNAEIKRTGFKVLT